MKILVISDLTECPGGVHTYLMNLETYFSSHSNISDIVICMEVNTRQSVDKYYDFKKSIFLPLSRKFHDEEKIVSAISNIFHRIKPDLVHVVNGSIKSNLIIRNFLKEIEVATVVTEQFIDSALLLSPALKSEIQSLNLLTSKVIYVSENNKRIAYQDFGIKNTYEIVHNYFKEYSIKKNNFSKKPYKFYTVARVVEQKGIDTIIKALALISGKVCFHIYGDGEKAMEYQALGAEILPESHEFKILGWKNHIDFKFIANNYDLFISASRAEGLSFSIVEAASIGMPVLCSYVSGNIELIKKCNCGQFFKMDDHHDLAMKLKLFMDDPLELNDMVAKNNKLVLDHFSYESSMNKIYNIYYDLVK